MEHMDNRTKLVISLTAIPPRFADLGATLASLGAQRLKPDSIELTIPRTYRRFPEHAFCLPEVPDFVTVVVEEEDLGPASKILSCARRYRGQNARIVYCDDDRVAPRDWFQDIIAVTRAHPECAIAASGSDLDRLGLGTIGERRQPRAQRRRSRADLIYRLKRMERILRGAATGRRLPKPGRNPFRAAGFVDIAEGLGGVSVAPDFFDDACFAIPKILWAVDDIWLSGSLERQGIGIWADPMVKVPTEHDGGRHSALAQSVIEGADRHNANMSCVSYMQETYGIWP